MAEPPPYSSFEDTGGDGWASGVARGGIRRRGEVRDTSQGCSSRAHQRAILLPPDASHNGNDDGDSRHGGGGGGGGAGMGGSRRSNSGGGFRHGDADSSSLGSKGWLSDSGLLDVPERGLCFHRRGCWAGGRLLLCHLCAEKVPLASTLRSSMNCAMRGIMDNPKEASEAKMRGEIPLRQLKHPGICCAEGLYQDRSSCRASAGHGILRWGHLAKTNLGKDGAAGPGAVVGEQKVTDIFVQLLSALEHIHSRNIIHRDLPANILLRCWEAHCEDRRLWRQQVWNVCRDDSWHAVLSSTRAL